MIIHGDSLQELKDIPNDSIDFVCTDPPYGYSFMGKDWDKAVPSVEIWQECLRVLKPGAFMCVMSAPRSDVQNAMISRLMEAGFNMAYSPIYWSFASGFPKSLNIAGNIGKIIDRICKNIHANIVAKLSADIEASTKAAEVIAVQSVDISPKHMTLHVDSAASKSVNHYASKSVKVTVPNSVITQLCEQALSKIKGAEASKIELGNLKSLNELDINALCVELIESLKLIILSQYNSFLNLDMTLPMDSALATNVITTESTMGHLTTSMVDMLEKKLKESTEHLKGSYGGAQFKPAVEVVLIASKPLSEKTYVDQALKNGKGISWLDDGRIPTEETITMGDRPKSVGGILNETDELKSYTQNQAGRFPANLLVSDDVLNDGVERKSGKMRAGAANHSHWQEKSWDSPETIGDSGSYSRYFDLDMWNSKAYNRENNNRGNQCQADELPGSENSSLVANNAVSSSRTGQATELSNITSALRVATPSSVSVNQSLPVNSAAKKQDSIETSTAPKSVVTKHDTATSTEQSSTSESGSTTATTPNKLTESNLTNARDANNLNDTLNDIIQACLNLQQSYGYANLATGELKQQEADTARLSKLLENLPEQQRKTYPFAIFAKASKSEKNKGLEQLPKKATERYGDRGQGPLPQQTPPKHTPESNHHPTVKPLKLMSYLITLFSRPGDTVLDPFVGSGTTCVAADQLDRKPIGIEREAEYVEIAKARLAHVQPSIELQKVEQDAEQMEELEQTLNVVHEQMRLI